MPYALEGVLEIFSGAKLRHLYRRDLDALFGVTRVHAAPGRTFAHAKLTEPGECHFATLAQGFRHFGFKSNEDLLHLLLLPVQTFSDLRSEFRTVHELDVYDFGERRKLQGPSSFRINVEDGTVHLRFSRLWNDVLQGHGRQLVVKH